MTSFEILEIEELRILAKFRNLDGHKNISRQQLESIFETPSATKLTLTPKSKPVSRPKKFSPISINKDELEKIKMAKKDH